MTVLVQPTSVNPVTRTALVRVECDECGSILHVTAADDCRLTFVAARAAIAHESECKGRPTPVVEPVCGAKRGNWRCIADLFHPDAAHYFVREANV